MSLEELLAREAIRETMARYNMAGDRLREAEFLAVFTEDAVLESEGSGGRDFRHEGREAIAAWIAGWRQPRAGSGASPRRTDAPRFVRHHLTTSLIELTGAGTASARSYWMVYTQIGPDHCGLYLDSFRRAGDRWLIAHRRVRTEWHAPGGLFRPDADE